MAIQVLNRPKSVSDSLSESLLEGLGAYGQYKIKQGAEKRFSEKRKGEEQQEQGNLSLALQARGYDKKEADAYSKLDKNILGEFLRQDRERDLTGGQPMDQLQQQQPQPMGQQPQIGQMMNQALEGQQEPMGGATPTQEQQRLQEAQLGMGPEQMMQAQGPQTQLSTSGTMPMKELMQMRQMFQEGLESKEINKKDAKAFLKTMGLDEETSKMIMGNKVNKKIAMFFLKMANQDPAKARELAKQFGYGS